MLRPPEPENSVQNFPPMASAIPRAMRRPIPAHVRKVRIPSFLRSGPAVRMVRSDVKEDGPFRFLLREDSDLNCPFGCKGDGVGHHVSEDLAKPRAVPQEKLRNGRIYVKFQGKPPFPDRKGERPDRPGTG